MLYGGDLGGSQHQRSRKASLFHEISARGNVLWRREVSAAENDAGIDRCALERDLDANAGVQRDAGGGDVASDGVLLRHSESIGFAGPAARVAE